MKFQTIGNPKNPIALMIHAMFMDNEMFRNVSDLLKENYYIVLPVLSAHDLTEHWIYVTTMDIDPRRHLHSQKKTPHGMSFLLAPQVGLLSERRCLTVQTNFFPASTM